MRGALRDYIVQHFMFGGSPTDLEDGTPLLETGILDSTSVLELVMHLEETYAVSVDASELLPENLGSIERIVAFLGRKKVTIEA